ncbi:hypothetical protein Gogos_011287, partial [Gossypium gossypioides]|nr:hypothetical protein [Gossypium gossypioides]
FYAELWEILDFTQREGRKKIFIHTDNLEIVKALQDIHLTELTSALVRRIHMILQTMEQWEFKYIPRERNQVQDRLAKLVSESNATMQVFEKVLEELVAVVDIVRATNINV